ncbi:hypothetical protein B7C42_01642 [Nocardia cerradoensis]|uniref:Major capsid protein n=1 Tax=Nocardia cerradoensis TaxID=85688 RepID=A0A231HD77_9NOCA|nr:hypothetical protein [Nocardia cerradoensis]OXR46667.1 hypothetical protein B7C42_01642 [Nocardia cerradoensis]
MANNAFPPGWPSLSGDVLSINRFLKDPLWVLRALRTIGDQMFISKRVLTGQFYTESGSIAYEQNESIYADGTPRAIPPGGEYPVTTTGTGPASLANVIKWGQDTEFTWESISRQKYDVVRRGLLKLVNSHIQQIDSVALSAVASAVTQTAAAIAPWDGSGTTPQILRDLMRAYATIIDLKQGYMPDVVLLEPIVFANTVSDPSLMNLLPREVPGVSSAPVNGGWESPYMRKIGGFTFITSPNLPTLGRVTLLDSSVFGGFADERLNDPGYVGSTDEGADGIQVKTFPEDKTDSIRVRARRITTPLVLEPAAAVAITGVKGA